MRCRACGGETGEVFDHHGRKLCEDCYLEALSPVRTCDPWASYTAGRLETRDEDLSVDQSRILSLLARGPVEESRARGRLGLSRFRLEREVAALGRMGKVRVFPAGEERLLVLSHQVNPEWVES